MQENFTVKNVSIVPSFHCVIYFHHHARSEYIQPAQARLLYCTYSTSQRLNHTQSGPAVRERDNHTLIEEQRTTFVLDGCPSSPGPADRHDSEHTHQSEGGFNSHYSYEYLLKMNCLCLCVYLFVCVFWHLCFWQEARRRDATRTQNDKNTASCGSAETRARRHDSTKNGRNKARVGGCSSSLASYRHRLRYKSVHPKTHVLIISNPFFIILVGRVNAPRSPTHTHTHRPTHLETQIINDARPLRKNAFCPN